MSVEEVARIARVAPSTVVRVVRGDPGVHLDTLCAVATAVGLNLSVKAFPKAQPSLRDSGQLGIAEYLVSTAHSSLRPALEVPVGDPYGRAADLVLFSANEVLHIEIERRIVDFQATFRVAMLKRDALQARHTRPVRFVLAIEDSQKNRQLLAANMTVIRTALPATSTRILRCLRTGGSLGADGLLWVRPWRRPAAQIIPDTAL